ncbi:PREDICTED: uncharacterized protein LOC109227749 [Nicotiana attenuata]|uniref:uncharacterized protein LOC109227749 n=1 Tax=Nicotiana attenuata TaxID=49451 RepID=UPI000905CADE|nr:PREDICTED: uncharacterized protein LOC109227749 [Nicotiana attenuata]
MGSLLFWYDNWTGLGALYFIVPQDFGIDETIHNVYDVVEEGSWNVNRLLEVLPEEYVLHIIEKNKSPTAYEVLDIPYWMLETRGFFSVRTTWEYLRRRDDPRVAYKMIWVKGLPFKISFFMWKVWKAKLPLDDFMRRLGYFMPSKCWCCSQPKEETLQHMFFMSDTARSVDKVVWEFPRECWLKVNTDGASRGNPGRSAIGYNARDEKGDIVFAEWKEINETTNTEAEAMAIVEALRYCRMQQYSQVCVQTDSMLMKKIIEGMWKPP